MRAHPGGPYGTQGARRVVACGGAPWSRPSSASAPRAADEALGLRRRGVKLHRVWTTPPKPLTPGPRRKFGFTLISGARSQRSTLDRAEEWDKRRAPWRAPRARVRRREDRRWRSRRGRPTRARTTAAARRVASRSSFWSRGRSGVAALARLTAATSRSGGPPALLV